MKKLWTLLTLSGMMLIILGSVATASVPKLINYQGMLTDELGNPSTGNYDMIFRIYNAASGGEPRWEETHTGVSVVNGLFNVILGSEDPAGLDLDFSEEYWLDITVGGEQMPTRLRLTSVGYAYRALLADSASVAISAPTGGGWTDEGTVVRLATGTDSVGIGTTSPQYKLDVRGDRIQLKEDGTDDWMAMRTDGDGLDFQFEGGNLYLQSTTDGENILLNPNRNSNVGIGTTTPLQKLHVAGTAQMNGFKMPTGASSGRVLTSDAAGVGTWQTASGGGIGGSGTTNYIPKFTASTTLGNSTIYESSGNVGIGMTSPNRKVYIVGSTSGLSYPLKLDNPHSDYQTDAVGVLFSVGGDGGHQLSTGRGKGALVYQLTDTWNRGSFHFLQGSGTNADVCNFNDVVMTIKNNGNVGIGTTSPNSLLELKGSDATLALNTTSALSQLGFQQYGANKWSLAYNSDSEYFYFYDHTSKGGTRMVIEDSTGNVGIGATPPEHKLDVRGDRIQLKEDATGDWIAMRTDGDVLDFSFSGGHLYMQSLNAGEHILLNPSTNSRVGIGTSSPLTKLHVDASGCEARLGYEGYSGSSLGIWAEGAYAGGSFSDTESGNFCYAGYSSYKTYGTGSNDFVQNHPYKKNRVITYAGLEGDEVATYTRGHARLINGELRVELGETFKWVTNPDIGLTAHITPRGECEGLYVASLTTSEMVVKEMRGGNSNVEFDYLICGLRIGFEEASVVQEKTQEAYIPSMNDHRDLYGRYPELRQYNAMERFKRMNTQVGRLVPDMGASRTLRDAIHEFDPAIDKLPEPDGM